MLWTVTDWTNAFFGAGLKGKRIWFACHILRDQFEIVSVVCFEPVSF